VVPADRTQALAHAHQQTATAHREENRRRLSVALSHELGVQLVYQGRVPAMQQPVVEGMHGGQPPVRRSHQGACMRVCLIPHGAMHLHSGAQRTQTCAHPLTGGLGDHHHHGHPQSTPTDGRRQTGVASATADQTLCTVGHRLTTVLTHSAHLERAARLQQLQFEENIDAQEITQLVGADQWRFDVERC